MPPIFRAQMTYALNMEALISPEALTFILMIFLTNIDTYQITLCYNAQHHNLYFHRREDFKSQNETRLGEISRRFMQVSFSDAIHRKRINGDDSANIERRKNDGISHY